MRATAEPQRHSSHTSAGLGCWREPRVRRNRRMGTVSPRSNPLYAFALGVEQHTVGSVVGLIGTL
jgi:hypothetical protein